MAKQKSKGKKSIKHRVLLVGFFLTSVAILPTTVLFFFGMMPSIVARFIDTSSQKMRTLTITFMNMAAVFPFFFQLIQKGHSLDHTLEILTDPLNIVIMYGGAFMGYLIDWGLSGIVATMMVQKGHTRLKQIKKTQQELITRWGEEVTGEIPLDRFGFPVKNEEDN
ncbi:MAG TPA: hypothetical protein PLK94_02400 [Alphaproteobacteria bacterium]|nr:hypothetical protein [Alphaproteobacteria bacterium]HOO50118.1 hypothetical protein [Alphaproteobacteria bacterium]